MSGKRAEGEEFFPLFLLFLIWVLFYPTELPKQRMQGRFFFLLLMESFSSCLWRGGEKESRGERERERECRRRKNKKKLQR